MFKDDYPQAENIGYNVLVARVYDDHGALQYLAFCHSCNDAEHVSGIPLVAGRWKIVADEPLTITPSIHCKACGHHGFVRNGMWMPA